MTYLTLRNTWDNNLLTIVIEETFPTPVSLEYGSNYTFPDETKFLGNELQDGHLPGIQETFVRYIINHVCPHVWNSSLLMSELDLFY